MHRALDALINSEKVMEEVAKLSFCSQRHPTYSVRKATEKDYKWIEEKKYEVRKEQTIPMILEELNHLVTLYGLDEFNPIIQTIQMQYTNISDQIQLYKDQLKRYTENGQASVVKQKREQILKSFDEEEKMIDSEIQSYEQTIKTYQTKLAALKQEESTLSQELSKMQSVLSKYEELQTQNARLVTEIEKEKQELARLKEERRRTLDNMLTTEEASELEKNRNELDASEHEEAALMVELEGLLKGIDSSLSLSATAQGDDKEQITKHITKLEQRHQLLRQICKEFIKEGKQNGSEIAIAMEILFQHNGDMLLNDLKTEMKKVIPNNPSIVLSTIYSLVGNQIIRIDRSTKEQRVLCLI